MPLSPVLLSHYRMPERYALMVGPDEAAAWLHAWCILWHPAVLRAAAHLPRMDEPDHHHDPLAEHLYAIPETPPAMLPDDWQQRLKQAGSWSVTSGADRADTIANFAATGAALLGDDTPEAVHRFAGLGLGYTFLSALASAMDHQFILDTDAFWADVQHAAHTNGDEQRNHLAAAAERLMAARDVLYSAPIHWLDFVLPGTQSKLADRLVTAQPFNLITSGEQLTQLPDNLRQRLRESQVEVCLGAYRERPDHRLPIESELWNINRGIRAAHETLNKVVTTYARQHSTFQPDSPRQLHRAGLTHAIRLAFDSSRVPETKAAALQWAAPNGRQVSAFTRAPYAADDAQTYFHIAHYLHQTIMQDHSACLPLIHKQNSPSVWLHDLFALAELAPVLGAFNTVSRYLTDGGTAEYAPVESADEYVDDPLDDLVNRKEANPVSRFAQHARNRRELDAARTYAALVASLGQSATAEEIAKLDDAEEQLELNASPEAAKQLSQHWAERLAQRLLAKSAGGRPGLLLLNPCGFTRRTIIERTDIIGLPTSPHIKAAQRDGELVRLVVEVPPLGFAWVSARNDESIPAKSSMVLADETGVRNEYFDAEIDPATGGLRSFRDQRDRGNRMSQQLIWQPGAKMVVDKMDVQAGTALGEVTCTGSLLDLHEQPLAKFRQRFRAWRGRPLLELNIAIEPLSMPEGYAWHACYSSRFAWKDERAVLRRSVGGRAELTNALRPMSNDFLEVQSSNRSTQIFTGGLPFHERQGSRMLDVVLIAPGETATTFDLALGLDRQQPMQTALGWISPVAVIPVETGPPRSGETGWLAHLDVSSVVLTSLRPVPGEPAVRARLMEVGGLGTSLNMRWARSPAAAKTIDGQGAELLSASIEGDSVQCDLTACDLADLEVRWG